MNISIHTTRIGIVQLVIGFFLLTLAISHAQADGSKSRSGFDNIPQFGGPSSVAGDLKESDTIAKRRRGKKEPKASSWFEMKKRLNEKHGFSFSINYSALYQAANESPGEDSAAGGIFQIPVSWTLLKTKAGGTGTVVFKAEHRHRLGTEIPPQDLGFAVGAVSITGTQFSDIDWALTNLYWQQKSANGRFNFVLGQVDATDYLDVYGMINPQTSFQNLSFSTNPSIASPNQGLGGAIGIAPSDKTYIVAGFSDANADPTDPFTTIDEGEYFKHIEIGLVSGSDRRYFDNIHVTYWEVDARVAAGVPPGDGWAFSAAKFINDRYMPFLRIGDSDGGGGALMEENVSIGLGIYRETRDLFGIGLSWGKPSVLSFGPGLEEQFTFETFYRFQISQTFAITADLQGIFDPAQNPDEDQIWIFGLRARLTL